MARKKKRTGFALMSRAKLLRVTARGGRRTQRKYNYKTGLAVMSKAILRRATIKAGRIAWQKGRLHKFSDVERRGGNLMRGQFFQKLGQPLPGIPTRLVELWEAAELLGLHENTVEKRIKQRLLRMEKPPGSFRRKVAVESIKKLRTKARKQYAKYLRRARKNMV